MKNWLKQNWLKAGLSISFLFLAAAGTRYGVIMYRGYLTKMAEKEKQAQELVLQQQKSLENAQIEIEKLKQQSIDLTKEQKSMQQKLSQNVTPSTTPSSALKDTSTIVEQWQPIIVQIICEWRYSAGQVAFTVGGSGTLMNLSGGSVVALTNRHVVYEEGSGPPYGCKIIVPNSSRIYENYQTTRSNSAIDWGTVYIKDPDAFIVNLSKRFSPTDLKPCFYKPEIGESIVVLGYPSIGGTGITATEGIISGYDGNFYVTSAKIEHGNSGGAAISVKNNCYLGIPTSVAVGEIESLGRILPLELVGR